MFSTKQATIGIGREFANLFSINLAGKGDYRNPAIIVTILIFAVLTTDFPPSLPWRSILALLKGTI